MHKFPIKYYRYAIEKTEAIVDKLNTFIFKRLREAIKLKITAIENAK